MAHTIAAACCALAAVTIIVLVRRLGLGSWTAVLLSLGVVFARRRHRGQQSDPTRR